MQPEEVGKPKRRETSICTRPGSSATSCRMAARSGWVRTWWVSRRVDTAFSCDPSGRTWGARRVQVSCHRFREEGPFLRVEGAQRSHDEPARWPGIADPVGGGHVSPDAMHLVHRRERAQHRHGVARENDERQTIWRRLRWRRHRGSPRFRRRVGAAAQRPSTGPSGSSPRRARWRISMSCLHGVPGTDPRRWPVVVNLKPGQEQ